MKKMMAMSVVASLLAGAVAVFSPSSAQAGGGGRSGASAGEIFQTEEDNACAYHEEGGRQYYLCVSLSPVYEASPNRWNVYVWKYERLGDRVEIVGFDNDISMALWQEETKVSEDFFANSGSYSANGEVDLSFIPCNYTAYLRAVTVSPVGCTEVGCLRDTGVIRTSRLCGGSSGG